MIINRFPANGVLIIGGSANLASNVFGLDTSIEDDAGNGHAGILITGGGNNVIGPSNFIAGNGNTTTGDGAGLEIAGSAGGNQIETNTFGANRLREIRAQPRGVLIRGGSDSNIVSDVNVIVGSTIAGVEISGEGTTGNTVAGNFIGIDRTSAAAANLDGVRIIEGAQSNTIGGDSPEERNLISGNTGDGVVVIGSPDNIISGNYIGTDEDGVVAVPNASEGVRIERAPGVRIGGTTVGQRNVISGNGFAGVTLAGQATSGTMILGNYFSLGPDGATSVPNHNFSLNVGNNVPGTLIGDGTPGGRNVIARSTGVNQPVRLLSGSDSTIHGNYIGTDATGTLVRGGGSWGIFVVEGATAAIGGASPGEGNLISGNSFGILFSEDGADTTVQGNLIGTMADGSTPLPNFVGIMASSGTTTGVTIGGTAAGTSNTIAFNLGDGIVVDDDTTHGIRIEGNSIHSNGGQGIDLGNDGVTPNDENEDADVGPNNLQNFPELVPNLDSTVTISLDSEPGTDYRLSIYSNTACDPSGFGEGEVFLTFGTLTTDAQGHLEADVTLPPGFITATATNQSTGDTSEFSECVELLEPIEPTPTPSPTPSASPTPTASPALSLTPTASPTGSVNPTRDATPSPTLPAPRQGDADCNGVVDVQDIVAALARAADISDSTCETGADVDCDGQVTPPDALEIALFLVDLESPPPDDCSPIGQLLA